MLINVVAMDMLKSKIPPGTITIQSIEPLHILAHLLYRYNSWSPSVTAQLNN